MTSIKSKLFYQIARATGTKKVFQSNETELFAYVNNTLRKRRFAEPSKKQLNTCDIEKKTLDGLTYYKVSPKGTFSDKAVLYAHGGAFIMEITPVHWHFITQTACETNSVFYVPIYPLAPEHSCIETFDFLLSLYENVILPTKPKKFFVMGDSAGGSISLSFAMYLREKNFPQPDHIILISPAIKMTSFTEEEIAKMAAINKSDPLLAPDSFETIGKWWSGDLELTHYMVSPLLGDFKGIGKITLITGTYDVLSVFCESLHQKALNEDIPLDYHVFEKMIHCFVVLPTKEAAEGRKIIYKALNS